MPRTITATFASRRDAETAVEHLVQEHDLPAGAVEIVAASDANTAGTETAGADLERGAPKPETEGEPKLAGRIQVSAQVEEADADKVISSFKAYGGQIAG